MTREYQRPGVSIHTHMEQYADFLLPLSIPHVKVCRQCLRICSSTGLLWRVIGTKLGDFGAY